MSWDQIENKWAAMTRRVRPDWQASATVGRTYPQQGDNGARTATGAIDGAVHSDAPAPAATALMVE